MAHPLLARFDGEVLGTGVFPDYKSQAAPLFTAARNILFRERKLTPFPGGVDLFTTGLSTPISGIEQVKVHGEPHVFYGTNTNLYSWNETEGIQTEGTGYSANYTSGLLWRITPWSTEVLAVNGTSDGLLRWQNHSGGFGAVSDFNSNYTSAQELIRWRQFAIALNLGTMEDGLAWCNTNDITTWTPTATNRAGSIRVRDLEAGINAAKHLRDAVVFFSLDSMYALNYVGGNEVFSIQRLQRGIGANGKYAITSVQGEIYGFGPKGMYVTDGNTYRYIHTPAVKEFVLTDLNEDARDRIMVYHDNRIESVIFMYPAGTSLYPNKGIAYNYRTGSWSPLEVDRTCASDIGVYEFPVTGSYTGRILEQSQFNTPPTQDLNYIVDCEVQTATIEFGWDELRYGELSYGGTYSVAG